MRYILFFVGLFFVKLSSAQEENLTSKNKDNCLGIYTGISLFQNFSRSTNDYFTLFPRVPFEPLLFVKHKKHEVIVGPILTSSFKNGYFIPGATLSYLYHFSKKRTNLFFEANIKNIWYTTNANDLMLSYAKSNKPDGSGMSDAKTMIIAVHAALGFEFKIFKFLSGQIAVGPGYYVEHSKPGMQTISYSNDPYNVNTTNNYYKNHYGFDWYVRIGLAWHIYNF